MMKKFFRISAVFGLIAGVWMVTAAATDLESEVAGKVAKLQGSAIAIQDATPRILRVGNDILVGDVISTGADSRLELRMVDDGIFTLGARTNFVVLEYVNQLGEGSAAMRLLSGAIGAISGKIASVDPRKFRLETETATIGIRGTQFWGGRLDGDMEFALLDGKGIIVSNKAGSVEITEIGDGTSVKDLATIPTNPTTWSAEKLERARATVAFQ